MVLPTVAHRPLAGLPTRSTHERSVAAVQPSREVEGEGEGERASGWRDLASTPPPETKD